jgi:hypothetical protein
MKTLTSRGMRSVFDLAAAKPHGVRLRYMAGCRCELCRKANSAYKNERQKARRRGDWNGIVSAQRARDHMLALSRKGVGRRAIQAATDVADSVLHEIRSGRKKNIRARTERLILAVTPDLASDGACISARASMRLIDRLIEEGYTKTKIAKLLGCKGHGLQFHYPQITVRNASRIRRLYERLTS